MGSPCRDMPQQGLSAPAQSEFPDIRLQYPFQSSERNQNVGLQPSLAGSFVKFGVLPRWMRIKNIDERLDFRDEPC
jgi:hypothetical protein